MSISESTLEKVLTALASDAPSPGSGAAAAVALAFAAACAGKAVAISRKHLAAEKSEALDAAQQRLDQIIRASLERADADAKLFESFIHHKDRQNAEAMVRADESAQALARELDGVLNEIDGMVHPVVVADIAAARVLLAAAGDIESRIRAENQHAALAVN